MFVSRFCVKVNDDFPVDDRDVDIQEGNGCKGAITLELNSRVDAIDVSSENVKIL